jgi:hypothetical protein
MLLRVQKGGTALHEASKAGHLKVVQYLCSRDEGGEQLLRAKTSVSFIFRGGLLSDEGQKGACRP